MRARWDLTALLNAADPRALPEERNLWLIRLLEYVRAAPTAQATAVEPLPDDGGATPWPVRKLRHLLDVLDRNPEHAASVAGLLRVTLAELDATGLLADFGFAPRQIFLSEMAERLRLAWLPGTPQTTDLGALFHLLFTEASDADWLDAIDEPTLVRVLRLCGGWPELRRAPQAAAAARGGPAADAAPLGWQAPLIESIQLLAGQMRANGLSPALRLRIDPALLAARPFQNVVHVAERLRELLLVDGNGGVAAPSEDFMQQAQYLRALLDRCRAAADSVHGHLAEYGISVDVVFQADQVRARSERIEALLDCVVSPEPALELRRLLATLVRAGAARRGVANLFRQHYALLARKVAERSAQTGEHYITRDPAEYRSMLRKAAGGGMVIAGTVFVKFAVMALALSAFWGGFLAGVNYAASFVVIHLLHWTVATKQPAMTAPALAARLEGISASDEAVESFVDEVAHLIRSQMAGIMGNLALVVPVVLALQGLAWWGLGRPLIGATTAHHVLDASTLLGPTAAFAAFTGVLLFASSLIAGWMENWFVFHRLDSAIAWNPRIVARLGVARAQRWARWWRANISGLAANVSLGLLLGIVPALAGFFGLPLEVRHVTLSTGQIAAALGTLGTGVFQQPQFWWCVAAIPVTGLLNLVVSFALAFRVAVASRGLKLSDRSRLYAALRHRLRTAPFSFVWPRAGAVA